MADEEADEEPGGCRRVKRFDGSSGTHLFLREFRCGIRVPKKSCSFRAAYKRVSPREPRSALWSRWDRPRLTRNRYDRNFDAIFWQSTRGNRLLDLSNVTLRDVRRWSTTTRLMLSTRCTQRCCTVTIGLRAARLQLRTGQWKCALLYARYTPDRTGYGQTADICSGESAPALFTRLQNFHCACKARSRLARSVDYLVNFEAWFLK